MVEFEKYGDMLAKGKISWNEIKSDISLLSRAIELEEDENGNLVVKAPEICAHILMDYKDVDKTIYLRLIDFVYKNESVAATIFLSENEKYSFLHASLTNRFLVLTKKQKEYAVAEAKFNRMNHGGREYDIRYQILKNPNWDLEEKRKLVYDFYEDEYDFMLHVDAFERKVVRHPANFQGNGISILEKDKLYDYDFFDLVKMYQDSMVAVEVFDEINVCRMLHHIRPITLRKNNKAYKKHH